MIDQEVIREIRGRIHGKIGLQDAINDELVAEWIENEVFQYASEHYMTLQQKRACIEHIYHSMRGYDVLQTLLNQAEITEIMVNRYDDIYIERGGKLEKTDVQFVSEEKLEDVIQLIVSQINRAVNTSSPIVDARLRDGSRVNIVLPPVSLNGPSITIRKFPEHTLSLDELVERDMLSREAAIFLANMVIAGYNIFISGGTGAGKTTFLNALSGCIPRDERVVTIEDAAELRLLHLPNIVRLEARNANMEGKGEVTIRSLIRNALRMRPSRIIVGEVRGAEAIDMLQAMNTGHDGSISTGHSNSVVDMLSRLETMVLSDAGLPVLVIRKQIAAAIDIIVHLERLRDYSRHVVGISELVGMDGDEFIINPLFQFVEDGAAENSGRLGQLMRTSHTLIRNSKWQKAGGHLGQIFSAVLERHSQPGPGYASS